MGNNLRTLFLKKIKKIKIDTIIRDKSLVIDAQSWTYQFLNSYTDSIGLPFKNSQGKVISHIWGFLKRIAILSKYTKKIIIVTDPETLPRASIKAKTKKNRQEIRQNNLKKFQELLKNNTDQEILKKQARYTTEVTSQIVNLLKEFTELLGLPFIRAYHQGEVTCAKLCQRGLADICLVDDWDIVYHKVDYVLRMIDYNTLKGELLELRSWQKENNYDNLQLYDTSILSGNDYSKGIQGIGPIGAYKLIKTYGSLEDLLSAIKKKQISDKKLQLSDQKIKELELIRKEGIIIFNENLVTTIEFSKPDFVKIKNFLINSCSFKPESVWPYFKKLYLHFRAISNL